MGVEIRVGHVLARLAEMPEKSVHMVWTSVPYWGLRCYGTVPQDWPNGWRGEHGLEPTLGQWLENEVTIWRAIRRVLRDDGTAWLNCGDAYASTPNGNSAASYVGKEDRSFRDKPVSTIGPIYDPAGCARGGGRRGDNKGNAGSVPEGRIVASGTFKPKDRLMMPARLAIALQDDGWYLRDEVVWAKMNPMPSSVKDRTMPAHEMLYLLAKKRRYYFDAVAIMEPIKESSVQHYAQAAIDEQQGGAKQDQHEAGFLKARTGSRRPNVIIRDLAAKSRQNTDERLIAYKKWEAKGGGWEATKFDRAGANKRSVWHLPLEPFNGAHFATAPTGIVIPPILASTSERGVCPHCGAPWRRRAAAGAEPHAAGGWAAGCACEGNEPVPATVLDPFGGAGTTALCADRLGRNAILIELNPDYAEIARARIEGDAPMLTRVKVSAA